VLKDLFLSTNGSVKWVRKKCKIKPVLFGNLSTVLGTTIALSLIDIFYGVLVGTEPHYYTYVLPVPVGFNMHYSLGFFLGKERVENNKTETNWE